jgi:hypothetical protein
MIRVDSFCSSLCRLNASCGNDSKRFHLFMPVLGTGFVAPNDSLFVPLVHSLLFVPLVHSLQLDLLLYPRNGGLGDAGLIGDVPDRQAVIEKF